MSAMNMLKSDRFELLSAYLDGEVTTAEKRQVEDWLANEPEIQGLYTRLSKLHQGLQTLPEPAGQPVEQTLKQVYARLDRSAYRVVWVGAAIAAFIGTLLSIAKIPQSREIATLPAPRALSTEPLIVALNTPVVEIPKAAVVSGSRASATWVSSICPARYSHKSIHSCAASAHQGEHRYPI